uniref:Uncharacterized protein n=1 Tax=Phaseolus vulgaris TaxID=3885 RepID=V7C497_PHAVU|nr:hypothetical protein PHAVU_004G178800g [Phaseolus vulgaris]ESW25002.1 hypothetical protein PHAVU_004G178800g [Phaseolus vulgaris]
MNPDTELNASTLLGKTLADQVAVLRLLFPGVQKMPGYIESAFRSSRTNEVYFFFRNKYMRLYYTPGQQTEIDDKILTDLRWICDDFPSLKDYANDKILSISTIDRMFPVLENTLFDNCIDSAFRSSRGKEVYLFKDNKYACIDYGSKQLIGTIRNITDGFPVLKGTIFEDRIHACFASHKENQAYLFKGENYVLINFTPGTTNYILVHVVKPIIDGWSSFRDILPIDLIPDAPLSCIYLSLDEIV